MIRDYSLQGSDIWCYQEPINVCGLRDVKTGQEYFWHVDEQGRSQPCEQPEIDLEDGVRARLRIHYSYSDIQRYNSLLTEWRQQIQDDIDEYNEINTCLDQLSNPFVFFSNISEKAGILLGKEDNEDLAEQFKGDNQYHE